MLKKPHIIFASLLAAFFAFSAVCRAESGAALIQANTHERYIDVFSAGAFNSESLTVKVSNQESEIIDSGIVSGKKTAVKTTVLIDVSGSIPKSVRDNIAELIETLIRDIKEGEQLRLVSFSDKIEILQDFTSDRYDLSNAAGAVEYNGKKSMIYDAVYNTMPDIQPTDDSPCYCRTVVITDGIDNTATGITKEELFLRLQSETYPVDVVAVSKEKQNEPEKELSALTRISGGKYMNIYPEADIASIISGLDAGSLFWIRAAVPESLLDGSVRQVDISDGSSSMQFDIKFPVAAAALPEAVGTTEAQIAAETAAVTENTQPLISSGSGENDNTILYILIAAAAAAAVLAAVAAVTASKRKPAPAAEYAPREETRISTAEKTEFYDEMSASADGCFKIKLSSAGDPGESWVLDIADGAVIGRAEDCAVRLSDKSVSREQCRISAGGAGTVITNLSGSNVTKLNGVSVNGETPLRPGDVIRFGRVSLRVDYIRKISEANVLPEDNPDRTGGSTESIF